MTEFSPFPSSLFLQEVFCAKIEGNEGNNDHREEAQINKLGLPGQGNVPLHPVVWLRGSSRWSSWIFANYRGAKKKR
jgi:hypothetical protein